jgi:hypothetical protein
MNRIIETDPKELKKFAKTMMMGAPVLGTVALTFGLWKEITHLQVIAYIFYGMSINALLAFLVAPILIFPIYVVLTTVGNTVQYLLTLIVLGFVYFVMVTPVAIFFRLSKRDRLKIVLDPPAESYWEPREPVPAELERYEKQH